MFEFIQIVYACSSSPEQTLSAAVNMLAVGFSFSAFVSVLFLIVIVFFKKYRIKGKKWLLKTTGKFFVVATGLLAVIIGTSTFALYLDSRADIEQMESKGWHPLC